MGFVETGMTRQFCEAHLRSHLKPHVPNCQTSFTFKTAGDTIMEI